MASNDFTLRRSIQPYVGLAVILFCVSLVAVVGSFQQHDWTVAGVMVSGSVFFVALNVFIGTRYLVSVKDDEIIQRAANYSITSIKFNEITRIQQETSDLQTLVSLRRPFRRIAIYAEGSTGTKFIDVSLKHFIAADIRRLMRAIHDKRPDLVLPKNWI